MADYVPIYETMGEWNNNNESGSSPPISAENLKHMEDGIKGSLQKNGGVMTGSLTLADNPENNMDAATKQYVDTNIKQVAFGSFTWVDENTSVGKIPDFDSGKYTVAIVNQGSNDGFTTSRFTLIPLNTWVQYGTQDVAENYGYYIKIDSTTGSVYLKYGKNISIKTSPEYLFLIPIKTINLIK